MVPETTQPDPLAGNNDRRRIPRYACSGLARITCLPLNGALLSGRLRDLGLGGCCIESIETPSQFDLGTRTEILVEVNSWFFRAMGHVRAVRNHSAISVEFLRMSAGGYSMLADLIADLERPRTVVPRPRRFPEHPPRLQRILSGPRPELGSTQNHRIALVGTIMLPDSAENTSTAAHRHSWFRDLHPGPASVDIFA
jgi:hypothetical protein